jgi:tryptophan synthase beta subunit
MRDLGLKHARIPIYSLDLLWGAPFPMIVRDFQTGISKEAILQKLDAAGVYPDYELQQWEW